MPKRSLGRTLTCALMGLTGCGVPMNGDDVVLRASAESGVETPQAPDDSTLCEIELGATSPSEVEAILGDTERRETAETTTLLYQYPSGLTLSLLFREDRFVDAAVYGGRYPNCWAADQQRLEDELTKLIEQERLLDAGVDAP